MIRRRLTPLADALLFPSLCFLMVLTSQLLDTRPATAEVFDIVENEHVDFDFSTRRGLRFRVREPDLRFRIGGRLHSDFSFAREDRTGLQRFDADLRRARLYLDARILGDFRFKIDREFAPDRRGWRNVFGEYRIAKQVSVRVGNFVAPFGLEDMTASNHSTFMERAASSALAPSFQTGILLKTKGRFGEKKSRHRWTASLAWTMEPLGHASNDRHGTEHHGVVARLTYAPLARKRAVVHFGVATEYRDVRGGKAFRINSRPEAGLLPTFLRTGSLADVDSTVTVAIETLLLKGPFTFQSEYVHMFLQRGAGRADPSFQGGYAQASWVLTGERRRYSRSSATLGGVRPSSPWGAVELGLRFSALDLNDETVNGGSLRNWTVGLNWYIRENVKLAANYVAIDARLRGASRRPDSPHVGQIRLQVFF